MDNNITGGFTMNNENFDDGMEYGLPDMVIPKYPFQPYSSFNSQTNEISNGMEGMITAMEGMDPYPDNMMGIIPEEQEMEVVRMVPVLGNNQVDVYEEEINPEKIQYDFIVDNRTLNAINTGDEKNFDGFEEPKFYDLDNAVYDNPQQQQQYDHNVIYEEYQPDTKEAFAGYLYQQPPAQVYRMETQPQQVHHQQYMFNEQKLQHPEEINYAPSPASTLYSSCQSPDNSIDSYFRPDNNANAEVICSPRSRKYSTTSSNGGKRIIGKVALEKEKKPYRSRMTKVEMEALTEKEREDRKKNQNRVNAKNCVSRKNGQKENMKTMLPTLEQNLKIVMDNNTNHEQSLLDAYERIIYPEYENNSPFGDAQRFIEQLDYAKTEASEKVRVDNNGQLYDLEKKSDEAAQKFREVEADRGNPNIPQNTYASRKSRAKTAKELAEFTYKSKFLEVQIGEARAMGAVLENFTKSINPVLEDLQVKLLPVKIVYHGFKQFEPS
ncbi:unnamed protein product [Caenorhabditis brenneri]